MKKEIITLFKPLIFLIAVFIPFLLMAWQQVPETFPSVAFKTFKPDTSVSGVKLIQWKSLIEKFGEDTSFVMMRLHKHKNYDFLYTHPTYDLHDLSICELKVEYAADYKKCGCVQFPDDAYETSLGIKLGMNLKQVRNIVGGPTLKFEYQDEIVLEYKETNKESDFLKRYHQPSYFAYYRFRNDSLKIIHFGFNTH